MCMHERAFKGMPMAKEQQGNSVSSLPDDLIESILGLLPLKSKLICRCVCKSWNSILSKDNFLLHTTNTRNRSSGYSNACLLLTTKGPFAYTLDPSSNIWHRLPKPAYPGASVLAASHGLVCIGNQVSECRSLIIFNLRCNTWKLLPNMLHVGFLHKVTMAMDPSTGAYAVVVTGEDISDFRGRRVYRLRTEVYDAVLGSWHMAGDALPEAKFGSDPGVWCDGLFYCITLLPYGLTVFSLSMGQWMELSVEMPKGIEVPSLVSCKGQLMMVGIQEDVQAVYNEIVLPSNSRNSLVSVRTRLRLPRSWSWSGPLQMWASSQLRSTLAAWPSIMTWTAAPSTVNTPCFLNVTIIIVIFLIIVFVVPTIEVIVNVPTVVTNIIALSITLIAFTSFITIPLITKEIRQNMETCARQAMEASRSNARGSWHRIYVAHDPEDGASMCRGRRGSLHHFTSEPKCCGFRCGG